ncbi:GNAT family N-acetyltransferase [Paenibacillus albicereus]|uniref:GNAT family N-acetyltransferase n=1 Tax=Paenibacillus albicereus TaxID=2726185 RepID=A0A6H2GUT1_9BACL|nr:GNAT family protein [Paenibacillus albicereus]QJC50908.1 GNAT family N-acetyltransferase [Paenibacillus albicereus]
MMNDLIISNELRIRKTDSEDLDYVLATEQHPESTDFVFLWSREKHLASISNQDHLHLIIENSDRRHIGYFILSGRTSPNSCIELIRMNMSAKGKGHGTKALRLLLDYLVHHLHVHRVWLDVMETNSRALHVYRSVGFKEEGILRECIKTRTGFESLIIMGILKSEWHDCDKSEP